MSYRKTIEDIDRFHLSTEQKDLLNIIKDFFNPGYLYSTGYTYLKVSLKINGYRLKIILTELSPIMCNEIKAMCLAQIRIIGAVQILEHSSFVEVELL